MLVAITASAQERFHYPCIRGIEKAGVKTRGILPTPNQDWDPTRTYRQVVLLVEYADSTFSMDDPKTYYDQLLNLTSSNTRGGVGCAADYFRDQSHGMFNLQFDVFGPIKVSQSAKSKYAGDNYGDKACLEAVKKAVDSLHIDFSPYDWNSDGEVEQVVMIVSSYCGNVGGSKFEKFLWPNTTHFYGNKVQAAENLYINQYSVSAEKWYNDIPCGIGTICHEFAHCLGLPDLYPTDGSAFSVVDEWDLMDGGNLTCWGWNPPNFSALEKNLLGWMSIDEITGNGEIKDLKSVADGGKAYKMTKSGNEFYLLENRQQTGWDKGLPGKGLTVYHVDYSANEWEDNSVNISGKYRYELLHADGLDYDAWVKHIKATGMTDYVDTENRMNRRHLSTSAYPFVSDTLEVHQCVEIPYSIFDIQMTDAGLISFVVDDGTGIAPVVATPKNDDLWYDLQGRRLNAEPTRKGLYIHNGKLISKH